MRTVGARKANGLVEAGCLVHRYTARACEASFELGNAFLLPHHEGTFDKIHVGGLCPAAKLPTLLRLLKPSGGKLVVPTGVELLCITKTGSEVCCARLHGATSYTIESYHASVLYASY